MSDKQHIELSPRMGSVQVIDGVYELTFERKIARPLSEIWQMLTQPEKMRLWLSPNLESDYSVLDLRENGKVRIQFMMAAPEGVISKLELQKILEIDWGSRQLSRWEIRDEGTRCLLLFTDKLPVLPSSVSATGWHAYMDFFEMALLSQTIPAEILSIWPAISAEHEAFYQNILSEVAAAQKPGNVSVTVARFLPASKSDVFDAWITPSRIASFMFGPTVRKETIVHLHVDGRLGGKFSMAVKRDGQIIDHIGEYLEFERSDRLTFSWGIAGESDGESVVTIAFLPAHQGSFIILTHQMASAWQDYAGRTMGGWNFMLNKLNETMTQSVKQPVVTAQMRIRKPVETVFEAFIDPEITKNFWFTKGSEKLETGKTVTWQWEMYGFSTQVSVEEVIPDQRILIKWGEPATTVLFAFSELSDGTTYVEITNTGFTQEGQELWAAINDNTGGFTTVLDGAKAYLEYGINLNLIIDKFPKEVGAHS